MHKVLMGLWTDEQDEQAFQRPNLLLAFPLSENSQLDVI